MPRIWEEPDPLTADMEVAGQRLAGHQHRARPSPGQPRRLATCRGLLVLVALGLLASCAPPPPEPPLVAPTATATQPSQAEPATRDLKRGIHLPPEPLSAFDYEALGLLQPGTVVLLSAQIGDADPLGQVVEDPSLETWLRARQDVQQIVRMWPVKTPEDPTALADRIVGLHRRYPWIRTFIPANEPDTEWPTPSWGEIAAWTTQVWQAVQHHRLTAPDAADIQLLFPPLAQGSKLDPERIGYDALAPAIRLYLDHGDGIAGHEYWDRDSVYLVEDRWPAWLRDRLAQVPFFVTEAGHRPLAANGHPDGTLGAELVQFAARTRARAVAPFVLSSPRGHFETQALVDRHGVLLPPLYAWGAARLGN